MEKDPNGLDAHYPGAKLDNGKTRMSLVLGGFPRALFAIGDVGTYGAKKYTDNGWEEVENGYERYEDAQMRHYLKSKYEELDEDSELLHAAHEAWNCLAKLELLLRNKENKVI